MKVRVSSEICAGFGICTGIAPEVFELHEDGYAVVLVGEVPPELEDAVRQAYTQCPARAIFISEDSAAD
jgi:ferredoxin